MTALTQKDICTPRFIAALFTVAKKEIPLVSIDRWMDNIYIHTHTHTNTHTMEYYSVIKIWNLAIYDNTDGPWRYYAKQNKSDRERQIPYDLANLWNLKKIIDTDWWLLEVGDGECVNGWGLSKGTNF